LTSMDAIVRSIKAPVSSTLALAHPLHYPTSEIATPGEEIEIRSIPLVGNFTFAGRSKRNR
jgi:hypothetical protein